MKRLFLLLLIAAIFVSVSQSGEVIRVTIDDFSWGLNTVRSGSKGPPGEGKIVHNVDLGKFPTHMTRRPGYTFSFGIPDTDSTLYNALFAYNRSDGNKELLVMADSINVGYASLFATNANNVDMGVRDSFLFVPDTSGQHGLDTFGLNPRGYFFRILESDTNLDNWTISVDSSWSASQIIDTFVIEINASGLGALLTASRSTDTMIIVENMNNLKLRFYDARWDFLRQASFGTPDNVLYTRFPAVGKLWWTQFRDRVYAGTGVSKGIVYDGKNVNSFPLQAPGETKGIPLTTASEPRGEYRYALRQISPAGIDNDTNFINQTGALSTPIVADNQLILHWDFPQPRVWRATDSLSDTVSYEILRSAGDIANLDKLDSLWAIDTIHTLLGETDTLTWTDTLSDSLMRANTTGYNAVSLLGDLKNRITFDGTDSPQATVYRVNKIHSPGSPIITAVAGVADSGMWQGGAADWDVVKGFSYMIVAVDTTQDSPSDSSRSVGFWQESEPEAYNSIWKLVAGGDSINTGFNRAGSEKMTVVLPKSNNDNLLYQLYRGPILNQKLDSTYYYYWTREYLAYLNIWLDVMHSGSRVFADSLFVAGYYLIGEFAPGATVYDSLRYDSLLARQIFKRNSVPRIIKSMITVDNQLIATDGDLIYTSDPTIDSITFNTFNAQPININDGDQIEAMWLQRGVVKIGKNKSTYNLYRDANGFWRKVELSKHYGCISTFSHASAPEGDYFLSSDGVRLESEGIYRERSFVGSLMSSKLRSFLNFTISQNKQTYAERYDNKYILSYPALDTSFVLHKIFMPDGSIRYGFATWSGLVMSGSAKYHTGQEISIYPGDSLYFTKAGSSNIYKYGGDLDDGGYSTTLWQSHDLIPITGYWMQPYSLGFEYESEDTSSTASFRAFFFRNEKGVTQSEYTINPAQLDTARYYYYDMAAGDVALTWSLLYNVNYSFGETIFRKFELEFIKRGRIRSP